MAHHRMPVFEQVRRRYCYLRGERLLLTTFWPQDYRRGTVYTLNNGTYRITRYFHATDDRFFEVWAEPIPS